jgi:hypothetical protein
VLRGAAADLHLDIDPIDHEPARRGRAGRDRGVIVLGSYAVARRIELAGRDGAVAAVRERVAGGQRVPFGEKARTQIVSGPDRGDERPATTIVWPFAATSPAISHSPRPIQLDTTCPCFMRATHAELLVSSGPRICPTTTIVPSPASIA